MINTSLLCLLSLIGAFTSGERNANPAMVSAYEVLRVYHKFQSQNATNHWAEYASQQFNLKADSFNFRFENAENFKLNQAMLDSLNKVESTQKIPVYIPIAIALSPVAGFVAWRTIQAKNRAFEMTKQYFEFKDSNGMMGDAYRHVLVSLLLRKYLNRPLAFHIMWTWEKKADVQKTNQPRNKYMDLHNNRIGRFLEFKTLKQGKTYQDWALATKTWIENKNNAAYWPWHKKPPSKAEAKQAAKSTPKNQYIYWR